jgi:hypothetical protein
MKENEKMFNNIYINDLNFNKFYDIHSINVKK